MPRFVLLRHDHPRGLHFDLMLETGGVLRTWALANVPEPDGTIDCRPLPDHRMAYLDYEGPVSGGRGSVVRWDRGTFRIQHDSGTDLVVELLGEKLVGVATLGPSTDATGSWQLIWTPTEDNEAKG